MYILLRLHTTTRVNFCTNTIVRVYFLYTIYLCIYLIYARDSSFPLIVFQYVLIFFTVLTSVEYASPKMEGCVL